MVSRCHLGSEINGFCLKKGQCLKATAGTNKTSPTWGIMLRLIWLKWNSSKWEFEDGDCRTVEKVFFIAANHSPYFQKLRIITKGNGANYLIFQAELRVFFCK